jgi:hypothetical protein
MRTNLRKFAVLLPSLLAFHLCATDDVESKVELGQGYRHDHLKFSIAGRHHKPNIISELDFKNLQVYLTSLKGTVTNGAYIGIVDLAYGDIIHGKVIDSDYFRNNRQSEFSRSRSKVTGDYTFDASAKIGRIFPMFSGITFTPSIGYGSFWQHLHMKHGHQERPRNHTHSIHHLNSTYKALWSAPFLDAQFSAPLTSALTADLGYAFFYPVHYRATGHWNLRHLRFVQKGHMSKSYGQRGNIGIRYACTDRLELGFGISVAQLIAKDGKIHFRGRDNAKGTQPSHRAKRLYEDYVLTLSYAF